MANYQPPLLGDSSLSASEVAGAFLRINTSGIEAAVERLLEIAGVFGEAQMKAAVREALKPIQKAYKANLPADVTGNLRKSVGTKVKTYNSGVTFGIVGPRHYASGSEWDVEERGAGNHAWLVEFGTKARRPGTQNRRTYVNVHRMINGKMKRHATGQTDEQFAKASRGYYFIMSSYNEPTRQKRKGSGYPYDFLMTRHPGQTYKKMPDARPMTRAIQAESGNARRALEQAIRRKITEFTD